MTISTQDAFADRAKAHLRNWGADTRHGHVEMLTAFAESEALRAPRQPLEADLAATLDRIVTEYPVNHGSTFCKNLAEAALRWYRMRPASPPSPQETRRALEAYAEIGMLREKLSDALAGGLPHHSDCAVYHAPAEEPGPCDCGIGVSVDDAALDLVRKIREHNGWTRVATEEDAVSLVKSFVAAALSTSPAPAEDVTNYEFPYQQTFDAICAAVTPSKEPPYAVTVSVRKFQEAFNSHPDKRSLTSPDPKQAMQDGRREDETGEEYEHRIGGRVTTSNDPKRAM